MTNLIICEICSYKWRGSYWCGRKAAAMAQFLQTYDIHNTMLHTNTEFTIWDNTHISAKIETFHAMSRYRHNTQTLFLIQLQWMFSLVIGCHTEMQELNIWSVACCTFLYWHQSVPIFVVSPELRTPVKYERDWKDLGGTFAKSKTLQASTLTNGALALSMYML